METLCDVPVETVIAIPAQLDTAQPFALQARQLAEGTDLTPEQWQSAPILVNLPSLGVIAGALCSEIHGRSGHVPSVLRLRAVPDAALTRYEVAEILNLEAMRQNARRSSHATTRFSAA